MAGSVGQYTQAWFPWVGEKSNTGGVTRQISVGDLGQGYAQTAAAQNSETTWDLYLDSVVWKACFVTNKGANRGILTLNFDGSSQGTVDLYDPAGGLPNQYNEITGITVTAPGVKAVQTKAATKNASSTNYYLLISSIALIRTGGTPSTPGGTDTPGYTWEVPGAWMGSKANTNWSTRSQLSNAFGGGYLLSSGAQNDAVSWDTWQDPGTYKVALVHYTDTNRGIYSVQFDGVTKGTIDTYAGLGAPNNYSEITGIVVATGAVVAVQLLMATKNASSTNYYAALQTIKIIRTGA